MTALDLDAVRRSYPSPKESARVIRALCDELESTRTQAADAEALRADAYEYQEAAEARIAAGLKACDQSQWATGTNLVADHVRRALTEDPS